MTGSVFFAQAAPDVTKARISAEFQKFGSITRIDFINRQTAGPESEEGNRTECGYIVFDSAEAADAATKSMHGTKELAAPGLVLLCASALSSPGPSTSLDASSRDTRPDLAGSEALKSPRVLDDLLQGLDSPCCSTSSAQVSTSDGTSEEEVCSRSVFFARVPPTIPVEVIQLIFRTCGEVVDVNLYKPWATSKTSKGCGIVEFMTQEAAEEAIRSLNNLSIFPEAQNPLFVGRKRLVNGRKQALNSSARLLNPLGRLSQASQHAYSVEHMDTSTDSDRDQCGTDSPCSHTSGVQAYASLPNDDEEHEKCSRSVYFARVPPTVAANEVEAIFATCGKVVVVNLFKPWATSKTSKGCGVVEYATAVAAKKAIATLNNRMVFLDARYPMFVEQCLPACCKPPKQPSKSTLSRLANQQPGTFGTLQQVQLPFAQHHLHQLHQTFLQQQKQPHAAMGFNPMWQIPAFGNMSVQMPLQAYLHAAYLGERPAMASGVHSGLAGLPCGSQLWTPSPQLQVAGQNPARLQAPGAMPGLGNGKMKAPQYLGNNPGQLYVNSEGECLVYELKGKVGNVQGKPMVVMRDRNSNDGLVDPPGLEPAGQSMQLCQPGGLAAQLAVHAAGGNLASLLGTQTCGGFRPDVLTPGLNGINAMHGMQLILPQPASNYLV